MPHSPRTQAIMTMAREFYLEMPGAQRVPRDAEGIALWGEVDGTPEFLFCQAIASAIIQASATIYVERD